MGRFQASASIWLDVPPKEVWDLATTNDDWRGPWVTEVIPVTDGPLRPGSRYENRLAGGGKKWTVVNEMTHVDAPKRLSWKQVGDPDGPTITIEGHYILEPHRGGTTFRLTGTYETTGKGPGPAWFNRMMLRRRVYPRYVKQLGKELASHSASSRG